MKVLALFLAVGMASASWASIGDRFPSERKVVKDPATGAELVFLTRGPKDDRKIYPTHNQWTSNGEWVVYHAGELKGEAMAVNEETGERVQLSEGRRGGKLCVARKSMKLYYLRRSNGGRGGPREIVEVDLARVLGGEEGDVVQRVCGVVPAGIGRADDMALDADEEWIWFRESKEEAARHLPEDTKLEAAFGPRHMGAGPGGIAGMDLRTGGLKHVVSVPFQVGHIQSNPWVPGQIVFCWETGGKSPQRTWIVHADGSGLKPLYPEASHEWVTHEAVITENEVAFAIMGHRRPGAGGPGQQAEWGPAGTREKPSGLGVIRIDTGEMTIAGQIPSGSGFWHVTGSPDGRFLAGDNFAREIHLIDRRTHEMRLLSAGHKATASDHPHPTFKPDGTKILIQSAMLADDGASMDLCVIPVPADLLAR